MKRFNVSILAVVAVLAIGLTAFTKAEPAKRETVANCYRNLVAAYNAPSDECVFSTFTLQPNISCTQTVKNQDDRGVSSIVSSSFNSSLICESTDLFFCCAQLELDETPCVAPPAGTPVQPTISFTDFAGTARVGKAKIHAIFCKTLQN